MKVIKTGKKKGGGEGEGEVERGSGREREGRAVEELAELQPSLRGLKPGGGSEDA